MLFDQSALSQHGLQHLQRQLPSHEDRVDHVSFDIGRDRDVQRHERTQLIRVTLVDAIVEEHEADLRHHAFHGIALRHSLRPFPADLVQYRASHRDRVGRRGLHLSTSHLHRRGSQIR